MKFDFHDRVALVTGAASGIGEEVVRGLVRAGAQVVIADRNYEAAMVLANELGANTRAFEVDVSAAEQVRAMVQFCQQEFGALHLAVNSAGISGRRETPIHELDVEAWQQVIDINLNGVFYCLKYEIEAMLQVGGGAIVNLGSILGQVGVPGSVGYVSSKHALVGMTKTAALDYAQKNVRINVVGPGYIDTPLIARGMSPEFRATLEGKHPLGRLGQAKEIADLVLFLLSDNAAFISGAYYLADGGYTIQ